MQVMGSNDPNGGGVTRPSEQPFMPLDPRPRKPSRQRLGRESGATERSEACFRVREAERIVGAAGPSIDH
jgi:hypothetical protein